MHAAEAFSLEPGERVPGTPQCGQDYSVPASVGEQGDCDMLPATDSNAVSRPTVWQSSMQCHMSKWPVPVKRGGEFSPRLRRRAAAFGVRITGMASGANALVFQVRTPCRCVRHEVPAALCPRARLSVSGSRGQRETGYWRPFDRSAEPESKDMYSIQPCPGAFVISNVPSALRRSWSKPI